MARIVHIAIKVEDLEKATKFYEDVFGIYQTKTGHARGHTSRHMTDGNIDLALMVYDSEDEAEAQLAGPGPCIHHIGIEVEDREATMKKIEEFGGSIFSDREEGALKFRAPDGNLAEIVGIGRYKKKNKSDKSRIVHVAMKVPDLEQATRFYENVFGFRQVATARNHQHVSRHADGETDLALMVYDSEMAAEAQPGRPRRIITASKSPIGKPAETIKRWRPDAFQAGALQSSRPRHRRRDRHRRQLRKGAARLTRSPHGAARRNAGTAARPAYVGVRRRAIRARVLSGCLEHFPEKWTPVFRKEM